MNARSSTRYLFGCVAFAACVLLLFVLWSQFFSRPLLERVQASAERGDWDRVISLTESVKPQDDERLSLVRMRALFERKRDEDALAILPRIDKDHLESEDLFLLGQSLIRRENRPLGWLAIEAAGKIDPKSRNAREFLRGGAEFRKSLGTTLAQVDKIAMVPDGRALATLVVSLVSKLASTGSTQFEFDRLARLERGELLKLTSPDSARKMLARICLEQGKADEAIACLRTSPHDPETSWLLSRAFLVSGQLDQATQALRDSSGFGENKPLQREPSQFAGAQSCEQCHAEIFAAQQQSRHAGTISQGEDLKSVFVPHAPITDPVDPGVTHQIVREGDQIKVSASWNGQEADSLIEAVLGSGNRGQTMIAKDRSGVHRVLHISYYTGNDSWDLTEKFRPVPTDVEGFVGDVLAENDFTSCMNCHMTQFPVPRVSDGSLLADRGIRCERCHGPGNHHIKAVESSFPDLAISRPGLAKPSDRLALCAQCHIANGEIPASDPRFIRFQATTLPYSRCFTQSGGQLDCVTCHNPHTKVETNPTYYEAKCLDCHASGSSVDAGGLKTMATKGAPCPVNRETGCIACHMPKVEEVMPGTSFSDHHIRIHKPKPQP